MAYTSTDRELAARVGGRIRELRLERSLKGPRDLARLILDDPAEIENFGSSLSAIERGNYFPRPSMLLLIASTLGVTVSHLFGDVDEDEAYKSGYRAALSDMGEKLSELRRREQ